MPIDFQAKTFTFNSGSGGPLTDTQIYGFGSNVIRWQSLVGPFTFNYTNDDHHVQTLSLDITTTQSGANVIVEAKYLLKDESDPADDAFDGHVEIVLLVERV
jgi:hypothetical protein